MRTSIVIISVILFPFFVNSQVDERQSYSLQAGIGRYDAMSVGLARKWNEISQSNLKAGYNFKVSDVKLFSASIGHHWKFADTGLVDYGAGAQLIYWSHNDDFGTWKNVGIEPLLFALFDPGRVKLGFQAGPQWNFNISKTVNYYTQFVWLKELDLNFNFAIYYEL